MIVLYNWPKVNHATRVTTLQLKQLICFYSDDDATDINLPSATGCPILAHTADTGTGKQY